MKKTVLTTSCLLAFSLGTPAFAQAASHGATSGADSHASGLQRQADPTSQKSRSTKAENGTSGSAATHADKRNDARDADNDQGAEVTSGTRTVEDPQTGEPEDDADAADGKTSR